MKKLIFIALLLFSTNVYAADSSKIEVRGSVDDGSTTVLDSGVITKYFGSGTRQQQSVSLTASAFTTISVPTGTKGVLIDVLTADGIKLKGVTADTGISLDSTFPVLIPLSTDGTATLGIQNMETAVQQIKLFWF